MRRSVARPAPIWSPTLAVRLSIWLHVGCLSAVAAVPACWSWAFLVVAGNHLALAAFGLWPKSRLFGPNLLRLPLASIRRGEVALTFDDGPDPLVTLPLLDMLDRHGAKASFFCIGRRAASHPDLVREIVRRGHSVENHSHTHPLAFAFRSLDALRREVEEAQRAVTAAAGRPPGFFRAPMGLRSPLLDPVLTQAGLRYISWTRRGYDAATGDADSVLRRLTHRLAAGDVILLHDGARARTRSGEPVVLAVLPRLLGAFEAHGLRPVSLPMAFRNSGADPTPQQQRQPRQKAQQQPQMHPAQQDIVAQVMKM